MHAQLEDIRNEFLTAQNRLQQLAADLPEQLWNVRPLPARWSTAECVAHLNLTSRAYLPILSSAIERARQLGARPQGRYRRDFTGWLLWKTMGPPVRIRTKTSAQFVPEAAGGRAEMLREFERLQQEQIECVEAADGLALTQVRIESPFDSRVNYNLYACLTILPRHQHRHLWQAEMVARALLDLDGT
jgi:hypothetical protein